MTGSIGKPRSERATAACRWLTERIAAVAKPGSGRRPEVWAAVEAASSGFLTTLARWERTGEEADFAAVRDRADDVVRAWRQVAA